jgi:hypothetical protein
MADYSSSLGVRTQTAGDVVVTLCDPLVTTQQASVDSGGRLTVNLVGIDGSTPTPVKVNSSGYMLVETAGSGGITQVSANTAANTELNPLFVTFTESTVVGTFVDYQTKASLAASNAFALYKNVTGGKTMIVDKIVVSGSGKIKAVVQTGPSATLVTKLVLFNSTANPNIDIDFSTHLQIVEAGGTERISVEITNYDIASQDVYLTIFGKEV